MAATTSSNFANILKRLYEDEETLQDFEQAEASFMAGLVDASRDRRPGGAGFYFPLWLADAHATGSGAEGATFPDAGQPTSYQASVNAVTFMSSFAITEQMMELGSGGNASFGGSILARHIAMTTRNLLFEVNRNVVAGHGTTRLCKVESTVTNASFTAALPEGALQIRPGRKIVQYDLDTGGTQSPATMVTVLDVNFQTRAVLTSASIVWTAGYSVYPVLVATGIVSSYGNGTNGLRNIADNGTLTTTLFGLTRSSTYGLNATVVTSGSGGTGTQPFSEALVRNAQARSRFNAGQELDEIWSNEGVVYEWLNEAVSNRVFFSSGASVNPYPMGYDGEVGITVAGRKIPFKIDRVIPSREFTILKRDLFQKHILRRLEWVGDGTGPGGSSEAQLLQAIASGGGNYAFSKVAAQCWMGNISCTMPKALVRVTEVADLLLAGDS